MSVHEGGPTMSLEAIEREYIRRVLDLVGGNKTRAADILGITRVTLRNKLAQHQIVDGENAANS
jgi:DNA-binding protein Fis